MLRKKELCFARSLNDHCLHVITILSFFWPDKGETLSWGGGQSGRLGHGHQSGIFGLIKSDRLSRWLMILCILHELMFSFDYYELLTTLFLLLFDGLLLSKTNHKLSYFNE